jgi:hypothetical protein
MGFAFLLAIATVIPVIVAKHVSIQFVQLQWSARNAQGTVTVSPREIVSATMVGAIVTTSLIVQ